MSDKTEEVTDDNDKEAIRAKARKVHLQSLLFAAQAVAVLMYM